jgi:hypothetical protein
MEAKKFWVVQSPWPEDRIMTYEAAVKEARIKAENNSGIGAQYFILEAIEVFRAEPPTPGPVVRKRIFRD